jgi:hypothetical protein
MGHLRSFWPGNRQIRFYILPAALPCTPLLPNFLSLLPSTRSCCQYGRKAYSISPSHSFPFHKIRYEDTHPSRRMCCLRCPANSYELFFHRPSLPLPPPPRAASFVLFILFFGCGFMPCNSHLPIRHFPGPLKKTRSIIPTVLSQQVVYPSSPHEHFDG